MDEEIIDIIEIKSYFNKLENQINWYQEELKKKDAQIISARIENSELNSAVSEKCKQLKQLKEKLKRRDTLCSSLEQSSMSQQKENENLAHENNILVKTVENMKEMLKTSAMEMNELHTENVKFKTELAACNEKKKIQQGNSSDMQERIASARKNLNSLTVEYEQFLKSHNEKMANKLQGDVTNLKHQLQTAIAEKYEVQIECSFYKGKSEELEKQIDMQKNRNNDNYYNEKMREQFREFQEIIEMQQAHIKLISTKIAEEFPNVNESTEINITLMESTETTS